MQPEFSISLLSHMTSNIGSIRMLHTMEHCMQQTTPHISLRMDDSIDLLIYWLIALLIGGDALEPRVIFRNVSGCG